MFNAQYSMINWNRNLNHSWRYTIMKHIVLLFLLANCIPAWSQITTDSVVGTWVWVDKEGKDQKLVITPDSVTVIHQYLVAPENKVWKTMSYTGRYTIVDGDMLHVIFWDDPREEQFYLIEKIKDGTITLVLDVPKRKTSGEKRIYKKE